MGARGAGSHLPLRAPNPLAAAPDRDTPTPINVARGGSWDDKGYVPQILRYARAEVDTLGPFDVARTLEMVGGSPDHLRHELIVSQKFRRHLASLKIRGFAYVPVILED